VLIIRGADIAQSDFNQTPLPFQTIPSALNAQYFLNDKTPPTDPDDD